MCLSGSENGPHACHDNCPLCWSMSLETLNGQLVTLGTVGFLAEVARLGCRFCKFLHDAAVALKPTGLRDVYPNTSITMRAVYHEDTSQGVASLNFTFITIENNEIRAERIEKDNVIMSVSECYGPVEEFSWTLRMGGFSFEPSLEKLFPVKPANPFIYSPGVFQIARDCMEDCIANHTHCRGTNEILPRRVLNIDNEDESRVFVHVSQPQQAARYMCLSYCWGDGEQVKLLKDTIDIFTTNGIVVGSLPQTIQDAIYVTRQLGVSYLWVDSLCILQDDDDDKTEIIADMPQIYKNATVTLSVASAKDCGKGFLSSRELVAEWIHTEASLPVSKVFRWPNVSSKTPDEIVGTLHLCSQNMGYGTLEFSREVINTRAWTFQESWLSKRLLIFGSAFPHWRCLDRTKSLTPLPTNSCFDAVMDQRMRGRLKFLSSAIPLPDLTQDDQSRTDVLGEWTDILEHYCARYVTYRDDMLPALSGLASEYNKVLRDDYVGGLWGSSLPWSLLWSRRSRQERVPQDKRPVPSRMLRLLWAIGNWKRTEIPQEDRVYACPSWSPLYAQTDVVFEKESNFVSHDRGETLITIHEAVNKPVSSIAPLGKSLFCYLDLTGPMCRMSWSEVAARFVFAVNRPHVYWDYIAPDHPSRLEMFAHEFGIVGNDQDFIEKITTMYYSNPDDQSYKMLAAMPPRPPPPTADDPLPDLEADVKDPSRMLANDSEFWFLEVTNTHTPSGLFLKRLRGNIFVRLGFFHMGRKITPDFNEIIGTEDIGPRKWAWEPLLRMRRVYLV